MEWDENDEKAGGVERDDQVDWAELDEKVDGVEWDDQLDWKGSLLPSFINEFELSFHL